MDHLARTQLRTPLNHVLMVTDVLETELGVKNVQPPRFFPTKDGYFSRSLQGAVSNLARMLRFAIFSLFFVGLPYVKPYLHNKKACFGACVFFFAMIALRWPGGRTASRCAENGLRDKQTLGDFDHGDVKQLLFTMRSSATHLLDIINDLLDVRCVLCVSWTICKESGAALTNHINFSVVERNDD